MKSVDLKKITFLKGFWSEYRDLVKNVVIPYQWDALNDNIPDAEPSHAIKNFQIASGVSEGSYNGFVFQDSDLYKWLEAVAYSLSSDPDATMEQNADDIIALIEGAQQQDGYVNTYFIVNGLEKRFTNLLDCHELYCLGHLIEAAIAYYEATGKRKLLDIAIRYSDLVDSLFGSEEDKIKGYPGHQIIEMALVKLKNVTGNERYGRLAEFFINERGQEPNYFISEWEKRERTGYWNPNDHSIPNLSYWQAHLPVIEQKVAVGHAVRAVYMYAAMADVARETNNEELKASCETLWSDIINKQMYITGGIGQTYQGEAFTFGYDLPNDTAYAETCASIGLVFFAQRMLMLNIDRQYSDVIERALYNGIISGMGIDGKSFLYVNPLEVLPDASENDPGKRHVKHIRQKWFGCSCCPPNLARLITSLGKYAYSVDDNTAYMHLYFSNSTRLDLDCGEITITQETNYPWDESISTIVGGGNKEFTLAFRIPSWCRNPKVSVNERSISIDGIKKGYLYIHRQWADSTTVLLEFPMPVEVMEANHLVRADAGKVSIQRGPIVYCLEEADNGKNLSALSLTNTSHFTVSSENSIQNGAVNIYGKGARRISQNSALYYPLENKAEETQITFIPYYLWGNRGAGEMSVWLRLGNSPHTK